jgi:hypothetical protein
MGRTDGLNEFTRRSTELRTHLKYEHETPLTIKTRYKSSCCVRKRQFCIQIEVKIPILLYTGCLANLGTILDSYRPMGKENKDDLNMTNTFFAKQVLCTVLDTMDFHCCNDVQNNRLQLRYIFLPVSQ